MGEEEDERANDGERGGLLRLGCSLLDTATFQASFMLTTTSVCILGPLKSTGVLPSMGCEFWDTEKPVSACLLLLSQL